MAYDFRSWLKVQPDDVKYNFHDCEGNCAIGKYMQAIGEEWDMSTYTGHVVKEFESYPQSKDFFALTKSTTFGELKRKLELV